MEYTFSQQIRWAWTVTKGYRAALLVYFVLELLAITMSLLFVLWTKRAIDIATNSSTADLKTALILVVVSILLTVVFRASASWINERTRIRMGLGLQRQVIEKQMISAWKVVKNWHTGDIQVRIQSDCNEVVAMLAHSAISFLLILIQLLASFVFLWSMDPMLALVVVAITPLFLLSKLYYKKMRRLSREVKQEESNYGVVMQENLRFRVLIRAMDLLTGRSAKLEQSQASLDRLKMEQLNFSTLTQLAMKMTINIGYLLTFIWGVYRLHVGQISFGTMTAFLQLVGRIQGPILKLFGFVPLFIRFRTSVERLMDLIAGEKESVRGTERLQGLEAIVIEDLMFKYEDHKVIDALNAEMRVGQSTAIMGASGKGKTTLIRLLLAVLKPEEGNIWAETSSKRLTLTPEHRVNFAYVPQGNSLFSGTIRENLQIGEGTANEDRMKHALWLACAEFVHDLPEGIDTVIGESGYGLSEGQAQRIAIARAMMRDTDIWLFDEITSALDQELSDILIRRLLQEGRDKICLFVTHDLKLAAACEQTIYMK